MKAGVMMELLWLDRVGLTPSYMVPYTSFQQNAQFTIKAKAPLQSQTYL